MAAGTPDTPNPRTEGQGAEPAARMRLDRLLVQRGLARSRDRARLLIEAGAVSVAGRTARRPSAEVAPDVALSLLDADHPYVSRGAFKLLAALEDFPVEVAVRVCLDVGASTGGFTDVLLRAGARRIYALDVGHGQLDASLRADPRVVDLAGVNMRTAPPDLLPGGADLAVVDVSFISLTLVLEAIALLLGAPGGQPVVCLVKPQFELGPQQIGKKGVVRRDADRWRALERVRSFAEGAGFVVGPHSESPLPGPEGNREFLLLLRTPPRPQV